MTSETMVLAEEDRQTLLAILDFCIPEDGSYNADWSEGKELRRRLRNSRFDRAILTRAEQVMVKNRLDTQLQVDSDFRSDGELPTLIYYKMAHLLWILTSDSSQYWSTEEEKKEEEEQISCHQCGITNYTYWYALHHTDGRIMKRLCIKCVGAGGLKE